VEGTLPPNQVNFPVHGSVPDPERFIAEEFIKAIKKSDISFDGIAKTMRDINEARHIAEPPRTTLYTHYSPSLDTIIKVTLQHSVNLFAECILNYLSYKKSGKSDETEATEIVTDFWKKKGVDVSGFIMNDGCGLARSNFITTQAQTQILRAIAKDTYFKIFYNCLPIAGASGALGGVGEGTFIENNLRGKSGYMTRARGYTGYVKNKKGEMLCFSLIANNYSCSPTEMKLKLEKLLVAIVE
jgi:D-alanyl-D-alanine carboxypeptidase/D-alanyl-D-alanine-endopeptidase (penicillin-binding protein 4)